MSTYQSPRREQQIALNATGYFDNILCLPGCDDLSPELCRAVLDEADKLATDVLASLNRPGDIEGCHLDAKGVRTPTGWHEAFAQFRHNGWPTLTAPVKWGGQGLPRLLGTMAEELWTSANLAFSILPLVTKSAAETLCRHASEEVKQRYVPPLVTGRWTGTMNLTEPDAGSDLSTLRTRAEPQPDGRYKLFGQKIFITYGDHNCAENIVHLVLARLPDAVPGVKGISLFACPKYLVKDDGSLGERNDVRCVSIEHKLGIHGSPTCVMAYGDHGGAWAELVGEPNRGLEFMFVMMNETRFGVGIEALALAERAHQQALTYAKERRQGREASTGEVNVPIIRHPDVKRMLLRMRALTMAMRGLIYFVAAQFDYHERDPDSARAAAARGLIDLLMPVVKGWSTDAANEVASLGVQVHGGMGFIEETGAAQHLRDARILPIYEGTNGIQAIDLIDRKILRDGARTIRKLLQLMRATSADLRAGGRLATLARKLEDQIQHLERAVEWVLTCGQQNSPDLLASATPFLQFMGTVCGSWQLACMALNERKTPGEEPQLMALVEFYFAHIGIDTAAHCERVLGGSASILAACFDEV
jgi:3-(methylthio)propanoyl-CoA dehydrogenase